MNNFFGVLSYPWQEPEASELHRLLAETFASSDEAIEIAQKAGLKRSMLRVNDVLYFLWKNILETASSKQVLRELVTVARSFLPDKHPTALFIDALLAGEIPEMAASLPRGANNTPVFIEVNDTITKDEALLFADDLTLEAGRLPGLINSLQALQKWMPSICHLIVNFDGVIKHGTGFRVGKDKLLTNWHVVHLNDNPASAVTAEFGYEDDGNGKIMDSEKIPCSINTIVSDKDDDWAVLTVEKPMKDENKWPIIKLADAVEPELKTPAFIIQHPEGQPKRVGYVRNMIADFNQRIVCYLTDTKDGSSGSPVFNNRGELIALHHAGGTPQKIPGLPPVKKNEGIRISRVLAGFVNKNVIL
jgi:V8-like Glu-specific endopeptidase